MPEPPLARYPDLTPDRGPARVGGDRLTRANRTAGQRRANAATDTGRSRAAVPRRALRRSAPWRVGAAKRLPPGYAPSAARAATRGRGCRAPGHSRRVRLYHRRPSRGNRGALRRGRRVLASGYSRLPSPASSHSTFSHSTFSHSTFSHSTSRMSIRSFSITCITGRKALRAEALLKLLWAILR